MIKDKDVRRLPTLPVGELDGWPSRSHASGPHGSLHWTRSSPVQMTFIAIATICARGT